MPFCERANAGILCRCITVNSTVSSRPGVNQSWCDRYLDISLQRKKTFISIVGELDFAITKLSDHNPNCRHCLNPPFVTECCVVRSALSQPPGSTGTATGTGLHVHVCSRHSIIGRRPTTSTSVQYSALVLL